METLHSFENVKKSYKCQSAEREAVDSNPGRTKTQGL